VRRDAFARIYETNAWNGAESLSGPGSSIGATKTIAVALQEIVEQLGARSVLDAGCGDSVWMPDLPRYIGVDIVPLAIERAGARHPDRTYLMADICEDPLPRRDVVICRDALQHLSFADGLAALANFRRSGAHWLIANSHRGGENLNITSGGWFEIALEAEPFSLGTPYREYPDGAWDEGVRWPTKYLGVWPL
jgi:SAM-dependent methyltransferase